MRSDGRLALVVYNAVAALGAAGVMMALVYSGALDAETHKGSTASTEDRPKASTVSRLSFVPPGALSGLRAATDPELASLGEEAFGPAVGAEANDGETSEAEAEEKLQWSTETRLAALQPPQSQSLPQPAFRLPWQSAKPAAPPRNYTLKARLAELTPTATMRLAAKFEAVGAPWPPAEITLIAIKDEKVLELHARPSGGGWKLIHRYRVLAASGGAGPKLVQGDKQVPEGVYRISFLNPNSAYHVSMRVNYPNAFDRQMAAKDGRKLLGGDIMIHGKNLSAGCLAMGDEAVEELFVLTAQTGLANVKLIIAPIDFRQNGIPMAEPGRPEWLPKLYAEVAAAMADFKQPQRSTGLLSFFMK